MNTHPKPAPSPVPVIPWAEPCWGILHAPFSFSFRSSTSPASAAHVTHCLSLGPSSQHCNSGQCHSHPAPSPIPHVFSNPCQVPKAATPSSHLMVRNPHWGSNQVFPQDLDRSDSNAEIPEFQQASVKTLASYHTGGRLDLCLTLLTWEMKVIK